MKGAARREKLSNKREDLEIKPTNEFIEQGKFSWWRHLQCMGNNVSAKSMVIKQ